MAENQVLCEKKTIFFNSGVEKSFFCGYFIYNALTVPSIHARMAESADATDLKSVAHKAYGFKSRSGYSFLQWATVPQKKCHHRSENKIFLRALAFFVLIVFA